MITELTLHLNVIADFDKQPHLAMIVKLTQVHIVQIENQLLLNVLVGSYPVCTMYLYIYTHTHTL